MKFQIMDHTGHTTVEFKKSEVKAAMERFAQIVADGKTAATRKAGSTDYTVTRTFDPEADETVFIPRLQGG